MKKNISIVLTACIAILAASPVFAASKKKAPSPEETVSKFVTTRYFSSEAIPEADIEKILTAGVNAESGSNKQPWHFTAVTSKDTLQEILDAVNARREKNGQKLLAEPQEGKAVETNIAHVPLLIVVSCDKGQELNAGLATQSMAIMAQLLGYGTKVESSPAVAINENLGIFAEKLGIPEGKQAVSIIKIGKVDTSITSNLDGFTKATTRNPLSQTTTRVK